MTKFKFAQSWWLCWSLALIFNITTKFWVKLIWLRVNTFEVSKQRKNRLNLNWIECNIAYLRWYNHAKFEVFTSAKKKRKKVFTYKIAMIWNLNFTRKKGFYHDFKNSYGQKAKTHLILDFYQFLANFFYIGFGVLSNQICAQLSIESTRLFFKIINFTIF